MKALILIGLVIGLGKIVQYLVRSDDEYARFDAWRIDNARREWREGMDGQSWNWQEFKKRKV